MITVANKIALGQIDCGIGGGVDTNSNLPLLYSKGLADVVKGFHKNGFSVPAVKNLLNLRPSDFAPDLPRKTARRFTATALTLDAAGPRRQFLVDALQKEKAGSCRLFPGGAAVTATAPT